MALRKASAYSKKKVRPYTRKSKSKSKSYIKTVPQHKIVKFKMGAVKDFEKGKFHHMIKLVTGEDVVIRDNALESSRQHIQKILNKEIPGNYYFEVKVYPHHILRENKMLTGAGADRMQSGMQKSFGSTVGRAAIVKKNQTIFLVAFFRENQRKSVISALSKIKAKIPCRTRLVYEKLK